MKAKFALGLFEKPLVADPAAAQAALNTPAHRALALRAAEEGVVLLKNTGGLLPLLAPAESAVKSVAVIGPNGRCSGIHPSHCFVSSCSWCWCGRCCWCWCCCWPSLPLLL